MYGNLKTARRDIEYNLQQLIPYVRQGYTVVCSEPSAALCLKDEMRLLVQSDEANQVSEHTVELMDYLRGRTEQFPPMPKAYADKTLAYRAPCHLNALHLSGISVNLLEKSGTHVTDINGGCCGLAGTAGMQKKHHDMSDAIGSLLKGRIDECDPDIILTECAACKMQIEHLTAKPVLHPIKIFAKAIPEKTCDFQQNG